MPNLPATRRINAQPLQHVELGKVRPRLGDFDHDGFNPLAPIRKAAPKQPEDQHDLLRPADLQSWSEVPVMRRLPGIDERQFPAADDILHEARAGVFWSWDIPSRCLSAAISEFRRLPPGTASPDRHTRGDRAHPEVAERTRAASLHRHFGSPWNRTYIVSKMRCLTASYSACSIKPWSSMAFNWASFFTGSSAAGGDGGAGAGGGAGGSGADGG